MHLTPTLDGQTLAGPNAFFITDKNDYAHRSDPEDFQKAVEFYLPSQEGIHLQAAYSGNRPKLFQNGKPVGEFIIERQGNWIHLLGIESPGLTAAPALARQLVTLI